MISSVQRWGCYPSYCIQFNRLNQIIAFNLKSTFQLLHINVRLKPVIPNDPTLLPVRTETGTDGREESRCTTKS